MKRTMTTVVLASLGLTLATGCGLTGQWASKSFEPEIARDDFGLFGTRFGDVDFTKANISLNKDGTYSAEIHYGERVQQSTGTFEVKGSKITFVDSKGYSETYDFKLSDDQKSLRLVRQIKGTDVVLDLARTS